MSFLEHPKHLISQRYRASAVEALERAAKLKDPDLRASWEYIATAYYALAEHLDRSYQSPEPLRLIGRK
jgi:hypothetical protein